MSSDDLAPRLTSAEIVRVYTEAERDIRAAFAMIEAAERRLGDTFDGRPYGRISFGTRDVHWCDPDRALIHTRHDVWHAIVERLGVRRMMSVARANELDEQIRRREMPEINEANVTALVEGFAQNLGRMLEEAVEEVFAWLRPRRSAYKTNTELEVGPKVILGHVVEPWGRYCSSWRLHYRRDAELTALENVFTALDGKGQITKTHYSAISTLIRDQAFSGVGETPYFRFRVYQNGNMHLEFRRLDLLARFNAIAGGKRLRPAPSEDACRA